MYVCPKVTFKAFFIPSKFLKSVFTFSATFSKTFLFVVAIFAFPNHSITTANISVSESSTKSFETGINPALSWIAYGSLSNFGASISFAISPFSSISTNVSTSPFF